MPSFLYTARDRRGILQTGQLDAVDEDEVVTVLQNRGLIVTRLSHKTAEMGQALQRRQMARRLHGKVTSDDLVLFCQQLATLLEAGIPLLKSLEVLSAQVESRALLVAVEQMRRDIEAGKTFRDALARHPNIFSSFWVNLIETGEASGHLAQSLHHLARYLESVRTLMRKASTALTYPVIMIVAAVIALAIFTLKIIPIFKGVFASMGLELPMLTLIVITVSSFVKQYFVLVVIGAIAAGYVLSQFVRSDQGRWLIDRLQLRLPGFNHFFMHFQLAQFSRGLSTLLESGVPILYGLEIMEHSATNQVYARAIGQVKESVREGKSLAEPMEATGLFPAMVVQMIQVGEEIGELGKMLDRVAKYYEEWLETFIERLAVMFEPIAIMVMAVVIGTIVLAMFLPIFRLAGGVRMS